jgi:hypothetical protein
MATRATLALVETSCKAIRHEGQRITYTLLPSAPVSAGQVSIAILTYVQ